MGNGHAPFCPHSGLQAHDPRRHISFKGAEWGHRMGQILNTISAGLMSYAVGRRVTVFHFGAARAEETKNNTHSPLPSSVQRLAEIDMTASLKNF